MNAFDRWAAKPPAILTRAELLERLNKRAAPAPEATLTPDTADAAEIKTSSALSNEMRIERLRSGLARISAALSHDQAQARLHGYVKARFERER